MQGQVQALALLQVLQWCQTSDCFLNLLRNKIFNSSLAPGNSTTTSEEESIRCTHSTQEMRNMDKLGFSKNLIPGPTAEPTSSLPSVWVTSCHTVDNWMALSACHHLYENTACVTVKLSFFKTFFMNFHDRVKSQGDCPAHWTKLLATITDSKQEEPGALECWESRAALNQGWDSELSIHPLSDPTADLQELHNLSLLMYESKRWQNYSSFLWLSVAGVLLRTIIQDIFKSGLNCVHKETEDLSLSLLLLHLWPGKVTSVSESTAQTWFDKYLGRGNAVFIFKGFALRCFFSGSCQADSLPYQTSTWGASKQAAVLAHHLAPGLTLALHLKFWVSPKPRENKEGGKKPYSALIPKSIIFGIQGLFNLNSTVYQFGTYYHLSYGLHGIGYMACFKTRQTKGLGHIASLLQGAARSLLI